MENQIITNIDEILERIAKACIRTGRNPEEVKLLLATKTVAADRIKIALQHGQTLIAENKVQELKEKYEALKHVSHASHFIGQWALCSYTNCFIIPNCKNSGC